VSASSTLSLSPDPALVNAKSTANQLLASMDMAKLVQMLTVAKPALTAYYHQSAVTDAQQLSAGIGKLLTASNAVDASVVLQNPAENVCVSSSVEVSRPVSDAERCSSTASCDSFQSSEFQKGTFLKL